MAKQFEYDITDTVNDMVACDQMRQEIEASVVITEQLDDDPLGILCTPTIVQFNFQTDLSAPSVTELTMLVEAHTGVGIPSADQLDNLTVAELPADGDPGNTFYVTDGNNGPGPVYFDGADWRWYSDNSVVA